MNQRKEKRKKEKRMEKGKYVGTPFTVGKILASSGNRTQDR
ncbi:MAG: hypothetical protein AB2693_30100 [Candidatus Thiodiazotropha sp.]